MSLIGQGLSVGFPKIQSCKNQIDRFRTKFGMTNFKKLCAFTLSELLLSLTIVGVISVLTVPVIVRNIQKQIFATQVKNFAAEIEQLAQQELVAHHTRNIFNTDFSDYQKLFSNKHFKIAKYCPTNGRNCWKKLGQYKLIKNGYWQGNGDPSVVLKNGIIIKYISQNLYGNKVVTFVFDINGNDKPNVIGRDTFSFHINQRGKVVDIGKFTTEKDPVKRCKNGPTLSGDWCYSVLVNNNWKMDY